MEKLNIDPAWILTMTKKEDNKPVSVGGLVTDINKAEASKSSEAKVVPETEPRTTIKISLGYGPDLNTLWRSLAVNQIDPEDFPVSLTVTEFKPSRRSINGGEVHYSTTISSPQELAGFINAMKMADDLNS